MSDLLANSAARVSFSGHETFPLRLLWLKKAYDAVTKRDATRRTFQEPEAIATFGVGKNMALSMRHWALASDILREHGDRLVPSPLAKLILDDAEGLDPYLEAPATLWLVHSALAGNPEAATTFFYGFNLLNQALFDRESLFEAIVSIARSRGVRTTPDTLRRDIDVFLRSYVSSGEAAEDAVEPLLAELGLIRESRISRQLEFVRGPKPSLPDGVFAVVLGRFWKEWHEDAPTLSVEQVTYSPGSPGRLFKLDEDSVVSRLTRIGEITDGAFYWSDTAGLRQVGLNRRLDEGELIRGSYSRAHH